MRAARVDRTQVEITRALRQIGASVEPRLSKLGHGVPDLLIGFRNQNWLLEVKDAQQPPSKRKLTPDELRWHTAWQGRVWVASSVEQAIQIVTTFNKEMP